MITVYRYNLFPGRTTYHLPKGAEILDAAEWQGTRVFWAKVDMEAPTEAREFYLAGTGHSLYDDCELVHVKSFEIEEWGRWHLFECKVR